MPQWLRWLEHTTLLFWKDEVSIDWVPVSTFLVSTTALYNLARQPFAGSVSWLGRESLIVALEVFLAIGLLLTAGLLGPFEKWAPKFMRLLALQLNLAMAFLAVNNVWQWAYSLSSFGIIAIVSSTLSSLFYLWYTWRMRSRRLGPNESRKRLLGETLLSAVAVTVVSSLILRYWVLPI